MLHLFLQLSEFLPNLGGALSLYMGATLMMSLELVELAFDLFSNTWAHICGGKAK